MTRRLKATAATVALTLTLALAFGLAFAAQAGAVKWICIVGEEEVTFVTAPDAARHGIERADEKAGQVFNERFGEVCRTE